MQSSSVVTSSAGINSSPTALVTGAASGLGLATAQHLARNGWKVYAGFRPDGRSAPALNATFDGRIHWVPLDVTSREARATAIATIERADGRLDALINNAGIHAAGPLEEIPERILREVMEVNFFGAINLTRECLPLMRRRKRGVIVMISSLSALIGLPFDGAYAASKFALEGASESLRFEVESFGIRVALLEPGAYATGLTSRDHTTPAEPSLYPAFERARRGRAPTASSGGDPQEVAERILSLVSGEGDQLRVPCGAQAAMVVARLATLDEAQRRAFALQAAGVM